jgi:exodeoxyribonuclease VII large subunit
LSIYYRYNESHITVLGQTYSHRAKIKSLGGQFISNRKTWQIPFSQENLAKIDDLCQAFGGSSLVQPQNKELKIEDLTHTTSPPPQTLKLHQLLENISQRLQQNFPSPLWIIGEIENISSNSYGYFLTLSEKDPDNPEKTISINATIWKSYYQKLEKKHEATTLKQILQEGMSVCVLARVKLYQGRGSLSLEVEDINPEHSYGALALAKKKVIQRLTKEGLLHKNKKNRLSPYPFRVGLICANSSRAYSDFCHQLLSGSFPGQIVFFHTKVQGTKVTDEIKKALDHLKDKKCDLVVITRGGGSRSDLRSFDDYELAKLIANYKIPILSAVGHHDDHSVCEEVSYHFVKTPTAAADYIIEKFSKGKSNLQNYQQLFEEITRKHLKTKLDNFTKNRSKFSLITQQIISKTKAENTNLSHLLKSFATKKTNYFANKLQTKSKLLEQIILKNKHKFFLQIKHLYNKVSSQDPSPWLEKGWTQLSSAGKKIYSSSNLKSKDIVTANLKDGKVTLEVKKIERKK